MTYRCNTEGCSLGDCPNCVAMEGAEARARRAETRVHVLAGHLGMETHDESLAAAAKALREHAQALRALVEELTDDEPCEYDHHGYCQAHSLDMRPCPHTRARGLLAGTP